MFTYYVVWQRRGNFSLDDDVIVMSQDMASEAGIVEGKARVATLYGWKETDVILVNWKRLD